MKEKFLNENFQTALVVSIIIIGCMLLITLSFSVNYNQERDLKFLKFHVKSFDEACDIKIVNQLIFITFYKPLDPEINIKKELDGYISEKSGIKGIIVKFQYNQREYLITKEHITLMY